MKRRSALLGMSAAFGAAALLAAAPALAHHSFAMFDRQKEITLKGTVKEFQWTNPHSFIEIEVPDDKGVTTAYSVEMNSPNNLTRQGWKSTSLKAGDKVVLLMNPLRDGSKGGLFVSVQLPDGKVLGDPTRLPGTATNPTAKPG
ncbi:MAG: DUF6152 family protein [Caulobacteraceae bacterium]